MMLFLRAQFIELCFVVRLEENLCFLLIFDKGENASEQIDLGACGTVD